jgi:hypothetical protein
MSSLADSLDDALGTDGEAEGEEDTEEAAVAAEGAGAVLYEYVFELVEAWGERDDPPAPGGGGGGADALPTPRTPPPALARSLLELDLSSGDWLVASGDARGP